MILVRLLFIISPSDDGREFLRTREIILRQLPQHNIRLLSAYREPERQPRVSEAMAVEVEEVRAAAGNRTIVGEDSLAADAVAAALEAGHTSSAGPQAYIDPSERLAMARTTKYLSS